MKRFVLCFLLFPLASFSAVQMKCISVGPGGDATISWLNTSSSTLFRSYHIYHSVNVAGPYSLIDSVNIYATSTYSDAAANANNVNAFYFIELKNTNGTTVSSDTIRAIRLNVIDPGDGYASLLWNTTHTPPISTNSSNYLIYREYPAGTFTLIDSVDVTVSSLNYLDEISICGDTVKYRIEVTDGSGCTSVSNVAGDYFIDRIAPSVPPIDSVSVDAFGNAVIGWTQSSSGDTYSYTVSQTDGTTSTTIATVIGIGTTFYQTSINATNGSQGFIIIGTDSCGNPSGNYPFQQTIFLEGTVDRCSKSIHLSWNAYINAPTTPVYNVVMNENGGADAVVGTTNATDFSLTGLKTDTTYCFRILTELNGAIATSTSNSFCATPDLPVAPQYSYIKSVSVFPNDVVTVIAYVDPVADIKEYHLQRANSETGNFVTVQSQSFTGISIIYFTDEVPTDQVRYYRIASVDSCDNDALSSQVSRTITLDSTSSGNFQNIFSWNSYQQWQGGTAQYLIYRSIDGIYNSSPIAVVTPFDSSFTDDVRDEFSSQGDFCYYIVAYEAPGNPYNFYDSARSNEICIRQKTSVFIPNAFHPGGVNNTFNPAEAFIGLEGYSLEIFDRFGELIFETSNPSEGWDGNASSHGCEMGVYVYRFKARDEKGTDIQKIGMVTLIR